MSSVGKMYFVCERLNNACMETKPQNLLVRITPSLQYYFR